MTVGSKTLRDPRLCGIKEKGKSARIAGDLLANDAGGRKIKEGVGGTKESRRKDTEKEKRRMTDGSWWEKKTWGHRKTPLPSLIRSRQLPFLPRRDLNPPFLKSPELKPFPPNLCPRHEDGHLFEPWRIYWFRGKECPT